MDERPIQTEPLVKLTSRLQGEGKKIVFTSGCFDILHAGHVRYLEEAKGCGDFLVVGLNSDVSVKMVKGAHRPLNNEQDRAEVLRALRAVDAVVIYSETDGCRLMAELRPDVYVKGGDYSQESFAALEEVRLMEQMGGTSKLLGVLPHRSTSGLIEKIKQTP